LGTKNHYLDGIPALFTAAEMLKDRMKNTAKPNLPSERVAVGQYFDITLLLLPLSCSWIYTGLLLREKCVHNLNTGTEWTTSLLFSLLQELVPLYDATRDELDGTIYDY
jgi:tRNA nucleotidyltransferase (CCA-adding enzyme)